MKARKEPLKHQLAWWIAWKLPKRVVYLALIRAWAHATTNGYGSTDATLVTMNEVVKRWELEMAGKESQKQRNDDRYAFWLRWILK